MPRMIVGVGTTMCGNCGRWLEVYMTERQINEYQLDSKTPLREVARMARCICIQVCIAASM